MIQQVVEVEILQRSGLFGMMATYGTYTCLAPTNDAIQKYLTEKGYPYRSLFSMDFQGLNSFGLPMFINESGDVTTSDLITHWLEKKGTVDYQGRSSFTEKW